jgi:hypothetical protein
MPPRRRGLGAPEQSASSAATGTAAAAAAVRRNALRVRGNGPM